MSRSPWATAASRSSWLSSKPGAPQRIRSWPKQPLGQRSACRHHERSEARTGRPSKQNGLPASGRPFRLLSCDGLGAADNVGRIQSLRTLLTLELHSLTFIQRLVPILLNRREVHKHIFAGGALDESITLCSVNPLHNALLFHGRLLSPLVCRRPANHPLKTRKAAGVRDAGQLLFLKCECGTAK